mmetsp:Transcript_23567/g.36755  ORF Transcript_23567/g.36755 Transcript_23567/m.36755 type:complete len:304 (-) Transcript_23567:39-950(-)
MTKSPYKLRDIKEVFEVLGVHQPQLLKTGRRAPSVVLSFGASGSLVPYSLGVAQYLLDHHPELVRRAYFIGSGSGVIPAICLALSRASSHPSSLEECVKRFNKVKLSLPFVINENERRTVVRNACQEIFTIDAPERVIQGCCSLFLHPNPSYIYGRLHGILDRYHVLYGLPISEWRSKDDLIECIEASMAPSEKYSLAFRNVPMVSASRFSFSPQVEQAIRHVYIHGFSGKGYRSCEKLHAHVFGHHGSVFNVASSSTVQNLCLSFPRMFSGVIERSFNQGYKDAKAYSRWEEDPYHYSRGTE